MGVSTYKTLQFKIKEKLFKLLSTLENGQTNFQKKKKENRQIEMVEVKGCSKNWGTMLFCSYPGNKNERNKLTNKEYFKKKKAKN